MTIGWVISIASMAAIIYAFDLLKAFEHKAAYVTYQESLWFLQKFYIKSKYKSIDAYRLYSN